MHELLFRIAQALNVAVMVISLSPNDFLYIFLVKLAVGSLLISYLTSVLFSSKSYSSHTQVIFHFSFVMIG